MESCATQSLITDAFGIYKTIASSIVLRYELRLPQRCVTSSATPFQCRWHHVPALSGDQPRVQLFRSRAATAPVYPSRNAVAVDSVGLKCLVLFWGLP